MKHLAIAVSLIAVASPSHAQTPHGTIMLYSDDAYSNCNLTSDVGPRGVFVVHDFTNGATGSQFKIENVSASGLSYLAELSDIQLTTGTSQDGVSLDYGGCRSGTFLLITITYWGNGSSPTCSRLEVVGDPASPSGEVEISPCSGQMLDHVGGALVVKGDSSCPCLSTPAETRTWGAVKAFYD